MRTTLELGQEIGYARLSIEAIAARAGTGKHTIYRRWPFKGAQFLITQVPEGNEFDVMRTLAVRQG